ncbi:MAG TPA: ATP-binding protein [Chitinispirillaceae bacterium]|nr:ATP-binding protein [Chitinispirillaceae bacterium]
MGYLDLARISVSSGKLTAIHDNLEEAMVVCRRAKDLTNRLLTFSKGGVPVKKIKSIAEISNSAVKMQAAGYSKRISCKIASDLPLCNIDEGLVRQVFYNIILNACQAIDDNGFVEINASEKTEKRNRNLLTYVEVRIMDNGPGIKKENLSKIFDPFFTTKAKGNGLGLSAAYSIIANHDGKISVESQEGKGTTFTISIPALSKDLQEKNLQYISSLDFVKKIKILWLDDEPFILKMAENILANFGCKVFSTTNYSVAVDFFTESQHKGAAFDLVVLDLIIKGGLGGKEVLKLMLEQCPTTKAVACGWLL